MEYFSAQSIKDLDKFFRLNLINACTGYKSANLIATKSKQGISNVAVFSSVTHLGSNPPLVGFILRPLVVERQTWKNIEETGIFSINQIHSSIIEAAHLSSAKYPDEISEFSITDLEEEYLENFHAPFVKSSKIKIGLSLKEVCQIKANNTQLVVGAVEHLFIENNLVKKDGWINHEKAKTVAITALDTYSEGKQLDRFEYAKPHEKIKSIQ